MMMSEQEQISRCIDLLIAAQNRDDLMLQRIISLELKVKQLEEQALPFGTTVTDTQNGSIVKINPNA
jgi:hypothetical protein